MLLKYSDFFEVDPGYKPVMTAEEIDKEPGLWLNFYPHSTFVDILKALLDKFENGNRSLWIYGAYGTGKTHAALVIQKLFNDEDARVEEYFEKRKNQLPKEVIEGIRKWRGKGVLPVFDYGSEGVNSTERFLVRIEKSISRACREGGFTIPIRGSADALIERVKQEGQHFFVARDSIQHRLEHLTRDIQNFEDFKNAISNPTYADGLLQDARNVLEQRHIYLTPSSEELLDWLDEIRRANHLNKIVFLWDEFTAYIDACRSDLKAFEKMAEEKAQQCGFHFVPITHSQITAYVASGSESAEKAKDRYTQLPLEIPPNTVFELGRDAMKIKPGMEEQWSRERDRLAAGVTQVVNAYMSQYLNDEVGMEDFKGVLPIHPMSAFLLIYLSQNLGSNVRSFFDYLKNIGGESEFQNFINKGGPEIANFQYLTVDYLWNYFVLRTDLGTSEEIIEIRNQFDTKSRSAQLTETEKRVFKAVLLYCLMSKTSGRENHELLMPTTENIVKAFEGDGSIINTQGILAEMSNRHCFAIVGGRCEVFQQGGGMDVVPEMDKMRNEFTRLIASPTAERLKGKIDEFGDKSRYIVKGFDGTQIKPSDITKKDQIGGGQPAEGNNILINFLFAKTPQEQLEIPDKVRKLARQFSGLRILFIAFPDVSFCDDVKDNWEKFIEHQARANLATDTAMKAVYEDHLKKMYSSWEMKIKEPQRKMRFYATNTNPGADPYEVEVTWNTLRGELQKHLKAYFPEGVDEFSGYFSSAYKVPPSALKAWAKAGMTAPEAPGAYQGIIRSFKDWEIGFEEQWFDENPEHPLAKMWNRANEYLQNTVYKGKYATISSLYREFSRYPYGLQQIGYSAFVLGFVLKGWVKEEKKLQWTNGQITKPLDQDTLSEIIEKVIQNDNSGKMKDEVQICRLSKEEREFTKGIAKAFGLSLDNDATPESTLSVLSGRLPQMSGNVPLWVLPKYIRENENEPSVEIISECIVDLCEALQSSSRNSVSRTEKVKKIGEQIIKTPGLVESLSSYLKPDVFELAFRNYIESEMPQLSELAREIGDQCNNYVVAVKELLAQEASWLWKEVDVAAVAEDIILQYRIIRSVRGICKISAFITYEDAIERLRRAIFENNKVSIQTLSMTQPVISRLSEFVTEDNLQHDQLKALNELLSQQAEIVQHTFFDPSLTVQLQVLKNLFGEALGEMPASDWKEIYNELSNGSNRSDADFRQTAWTEIEKFLENSLVRQLFEVWQEKTNSESPKAWSEATGFPADVLFADKNVADKVIMTVCSPGDFQKEAIKDIINLLQKEAEVLNSEEEWGDNFLRIYLPERYSKLDVNPQMLKEALAAKLGGDPNEWRKSPELNRAVETFVHEHYESHFKKKAVLKVSDLSDSQAKDKLLALVEKSPEIGLEILE